MDILPILRALARSKVGAILIGLQIALTLAIVCNKPVRHPAVRAAHAAQPTGIDEANIFTISGTRTSEPTDLEAQIRGDLAALRSLPKVVDAFSRISVLLDGNGYGPPMSVKPDQAHADRVGVRRRDEDVRIVDRLGAVLAFAEVVDEKRLARDAGAELVVGVMIELVDQDHVGPNALDDLGHVACLGVVGRREVAN